ncbi:hypothetical protein [Aliivibrio fischeri]|uniref:hypothetical protein n=1 Tax=Aliivibrio fischeri TaxID=668 RepID=UPI001F30690C|nr:hypothetical protein [Aliivibrio fischeri]MCE4934259.1 hypothetical protein [Aliivibrio fischeri]
MAENGPIEEVAKIVSDKLFKRFKWNQSGPCDQDFSCRKEASHKPAGKVQSHTHPVDVVFNYKDPYLNSTIYLNTDLKSYAASSIKVNMIESALISLGNTIDCAQNSPEWLSKYHTVTGNYEIRGMLFVYNHDNKCTKDFYEYFNPPKPENKKRRAKSVNLDRINLPKGKQLHIVEPNLINYMTTVSADMNELIQEGTFPKNKYGFYYPQLTYHKVSIADQYLPATIELIASPFMLIKHDAVIELDEDDNKVKSYDEGFVLYYNRSGSKDLEFLYLLDTLSRFQVLDGKNKIRIRCAHPDSSPEIKSNFKRAIEKYAHDWDCDDKYKKYLNEIELDVVPITKMSYCTQEISWK